MSNARGDVALFIDPGSYHFWRDELFNPNRPGAIGDSLLAPYIFLRNWFTERGVAVHTADFLVRREGTRARNIYMSLGITDHYAQLSRRSDVTLSAFFAIEAPIVEPGLYRELDKVSRRFNRVFSVSDTESLQPFLDGPVQLQHFRLPQSFNTVHDAIWEKRDRKFLVMINSNKLPRVYVNELYTERLRAIDYFSRADEIDLFGIGWDGPTVRVGTTSVPWTVRRIHHALRRGWQRISPDPILRGARRAYRGRLGRKAETLGSYNFAICFENMVLKGWITEKIFDCFFVGTVPVYLGAPEITDVVPSDCFIDMRNFANYDDLESFLKSLSPSEIQEYRMNARDYLASPAYQPFTKETFTERIARIVQEDTGIAL